MEPGREPQALPLGKNPKEIHVLLVDDEKLSRIVVGNLLRKCNYQGNDKARMRLYFDDFVAALTSVSGWNYANKSTKTRTIAHHMYINVVQLILRGVAGLELEATNKAAGALSVFTCVLVTFSS